MRRILAQEKGSHEFLGNESVRWRDDSAPEAQHLQPRMSGVTARVSAFPHLIMQRGSHTRQAADR
jgi:hypothetical protein